MSSPVPAVTRAFIGLISLLLAACALPPPVTPFEGKAAELAIAIDQGDTAAVRRLVRDVGVDPDDTFGQGGFPLIAWPVERGKFDGLTQLLDLGADPNARFKSARTDGLAADNAMVYAARVSDQRFLTLLLDRGGDPNTRDVNGDAITYTARLANAWPNLQLLVLRGADANFARSSGNTVIAWYTGLGNFKQAYWLLQHGADPAVKIEGVPGTLRDGAQPVLEHIFYLPVKPETVPWQRKCQQWVLERGIKRPPMPDFLKQRRIQLGLPSDAKDIPQG